MKINGYYIVAFILLFIVEVCIALYVHDDFVRPFMGDVFVVILIYFFLRIFVSRAVKLLPLYVFFFAVAVEIGQYFQLVKLLGMEDNTIMRIAIGSTFDFMDIVSYFGGFLCLLAWQRRENSRGN